MPYFIFEIIEESPTSKKLTKINTFDKYRPARDFCREERKNRDLDKKSQQIKMVHANTAAEAERLLTTVREAPVIGDD